MGVAAKRGKGRPDAYRTADGKRVPSVTTILGRFKDSGSLIHWAWKQGKEGLDYRVTRDKAASIGSAVHEVAEDWVHGAELDACEEKLVGMLDTPEDMGKALEAFGSFRRWVEREQPRIVATETAYVSELHRFGGTIDIEAEGDWQIDIKTGKGVYADHLLQIAAYDALREEHTGRRFKRFSVLHIPKDGGECAIYDWSELNEAREMFMFLNTAYRLDAIVVAKLKEAYVQRQAA